MSDFFTNIYNSTKDFLGVDGKVGYQGTYKAVPTTSASNVNTVKIPIPTRKPDTPVFNNVTLTTGGNDFFGNVTDFLNKAGGIVEKGTNLYFGTKSKIDQLETARDLEKIKLQSLTQAASNAPAPAQIVLPTVQDWFNDPRQAANMVTPAALYGSGVVQSGVSTLVLAGGALAVFLALRK